MYGENKYYYDNNGNVTKSMTKNGNGADDYSVTETTYNWRNAPVKVLTDGTDSAYYYDAVGNVLRMYTGELTNFTMSGLDNVSGTDFKVTKYTYDSQNRLISTTDALNHTSTNTYDINGNLVKTVDRNQNILNSVYDPMGNLIEKSAQESADAEKEDIYTYTYNRMGLPVTMTGNNITTSYTYDNIGRLIQESLTGGIQKEYNYDSNGNRILFKLTKDNAEQINTVYSYDKLDRVQTITNGTNMSTYTYNKNGQLLSDETDDFTTSYSYNAGGMITSLTTSDGTNQIQSHSYQYLPNGNISQKQSTVGTQSTQYNYQYDDAGRLTQEQYGTETKAYTYDPYGNRLQMTLSGTQSGTVGYTYDANNRLLKMTNNAGGTTEEINYTYDNNGNQISWMKNQIADSDGDAALSMETTGEDYGVYGYDMYNRVISYTDGVTTASYTYDANNLRQSKTVDNVTTNHIWDGQNMVMETKGTQVNKYYRGVNGITYASMNGTVSYYHKDAHGDVTALTDAIGTITKNYMYDSFGNQATEDEADTNPFRYAGEYFDAETGQIYLRNRYYDPATGRFISEDPVMDGLNWYVYCGNNPVNFVDPNGESTAPLTMLREFKFVSDRIGINKALQANSISNIAEKSGINYAKEHNMYEGDKLKTWQNAADAKRHMEWNSRMADEIGYDEAQIVGNIHEIAYLREKNLIIEETGSFIVTYMYQDTVMDLRNNAIGRNLTLNNALEDYTYDELFEYALEKNILITDANSAFDYFGITDCANELNQIQVMWDVESDILYVWSREDKDFKYEINLGV